MPAGAWEGGRWASGPDTAPPAAALISPDPQLKGTPRHRARSLTATGGCCIDQALPWQIWDLTASSALPAVISESTTTALVHAGSEQGDRSS